MIKQDICLLNGASNENLCKVNSLLLYGSSLDSTPIGLEPTIG